MILDNAYISFVNLDSRPDRLLRMQESLQAAGLSAVRTRGMLPEEYEGSPDRIRCMLSRPQKGAIGCYFSQLSIMREALRQGKHAFVMEDDLVFCRDFQKRLLYITRFCETHPHWDVLWMAGTFHVNPPWWHKDTLKRDAVITNDPRMMRTFGAFCTHAYIVNVASIEKILEGHARWLPASMGIDWSFIQMQPQLYTYAFVPGCIIQYDNQSNIGRGITQFSGFAKLGPYWYQDYMEDFDPVAFDWHEAAISLK